MAVGLDGGAEVFISRTTNDPSEQQECWDSTLAIITGCIGSAANQGWWNGDHIFQFYQAGMQPLNGNAPAKHPPIDPGQVLDRYIFGSGLQCRKMIGGQVVNGQCVQVWSDHQVGDDKNLAGQFKPNVCDGKCYPFPAGFGAIKVLGDGTSGTDCSVFSTTTCDTGSKVYDNGNTKETKAATLDQTGKGVQCYFKC